MHLLTEKIQCALWLRAIVYESINSAVILQYGFPSFCCSKINVIVKRQNLSILSTQLSIIEIPSRCSISFQCDLYIKQHKLYKTCGLFVIYKNTRLLQYFHTECTKNICIWWSLLWFTDVLRTLVAHLSTPCAPIFGPSHILTSKLRTSHLIVKQIMEGIKMC